MVQLKQGEQDQLLEFDESQEYQDDYKKLAINQFLRLYKKFQNYTLADQLNETQHPMSILWGDEIEGQVVKLDHVNKKVYMVYDNKNLFDSFDKNSDLYNFSLQSEYGAYQYETTPKFPYCTLSDLSNILENVQQRNTELKTYLKKDEKFINMPIFPLYGQENLQYFEKKDGKNLINNITQSKFLDDRLINNHPFFYCVTTNGILRQGQSPQVKIPIFKDVNTNFLPTESEPYPGHIYMDCSLYGAACCLQATFTARDVKQGRRLYDQLSILGPLFISMTAATPIHKGYLANTDTKWDILSQCLDNRTSEEKNKDSKKYTPKSGWDSISLFVSDEERNLDLYNNVQVQHLSEKLSFYLKEEQQEVGQKLDQKLENFLAFLLNQDALFIHKRDLENLNTDDTSQFNQIQAMNLLSMRLRPPPSLNSKIGWRVEFRTGDVQITDEENAAFLMLIYILGRLFYESDEINFYIPMSYVEENFARSSKINSVISQKFYFRTNVFDQGLPVIEELTINEIFFGKNQVFEGLYQISQRIWKEMEIKAYGKEKIQQNLHFQKTFEFINDKTTGKRKTTASWIRDFVLNHPEYQKDSKVSDSIAYDIINTLTQIAEKQKSEQNFSNIF